LVGTVSLPAMMIFLVYVLVKVSLGDPNMVIPLIAMGAIFLLQAILILITTRKLVYVFWMFVYMLSLPVWNLILPLYSFWHFDDFTWGKTRRVMGNDDSVGHGVGSTLRRSDVGVQVPTRKFSEWKMERAAYARKLRCEKKLRKDGIPNEESY
jgi:chitin synthase